MKPIDPAAYRTPAAFRTALEDRLRARETDAVPFERQRQLLVFERFLARVAHHFGDAVTLKGGLALELRIEEARSTKDIDLNLTGSPDAVLERLRACGRLDLHDWMQFEVTHNRDIRTDGVKYGGSAYIASCLLGGRAFANPFEVDVVVGGAMLRAPDVIPIDKVLGMDGFTSIPMRVLPVETHLAEKLHAYTFPRETENSRVRDLPDIALLAVIGPLHSDAIRAAIRQTFDHRGTHAPPRTLPDAPASWERRYERLAQEQGLRWKNLAEVLAAARAFLDPVLAGTPGTWEPQNWKWG